MARWREEDTVPVEPFRERFEYLHRTNQITSSEVCRRLEWMQVKRLADTSRLRRTLGLQMDAHGGLRQRITFETAERLIEALDMDPRDGGL